MMYAVILTEEARADLKEIREWITAEQSGAIASKYLRRLRQAIRDFAIAPHRGEHRPGIAMNQRSIGFERSTSIVFAIDDVNRRVEIVSVRHGGRQL